jgi:hypothetical protein
MVTAREKSARRRARGDLIRVEVEVRTADAARAIRLFARRDRAGEAGHAATVDDGSAGTARASCGDGTRLLAVTLGELLGPSPSAALVKRAEGMARTIAEAAERQRMAGRLTSEEDRE